MRLQTNLNPFPTYFVSHGGPTFMYKSESTGNLGAWKTIKELGRVIKNESKPDYIIVVSAHWQSGGQNMIEVGAPDLREGHQELESPLIYDFHGFPRHMYSEQFHTKNSLPMAREITKHLQSNGFQSKLTKRGIDHGVWVPLKVAFTDYNSFSEKQPNGLDLPETSLIQVSLTSNENDFSTHYKLGQVLNHFRENMFWDEGQQKYLKGLVICSGMSVHNLHDLGVMFRNPGSVMPYTKPFNDLLTKTLVSSPNNLQDFLDIQQNQSQLLRLAHPTVEHLVPAIVAAGINNVSSGKVQELYNDENGSLGWGIYQFG